jgi:hypothetical protein
MRLAAHFKPNSRSRRWRAAANKIVVHPEKLTSLSKAEHATAKK